MDESKIAHFLERLGTNKQQAKKKVHLNYNSKLHFLVATVPFSQCFFFCLNALGELSGGRKNKHPLLPLKPSFPLDEAECDNALLVFQFWGKLVLDETEKATQNILPKQMCIDDSGKNGGKLGN